MLMKPAAKLVTSFADLDGELRVLMVHQIITDNKTPFIHPSVHFTHSTCLDRSYIEVQVDDGTVLKVIGKDNTEILYKEFL